MIVHVFVHVHENVTADIGTVQFAWRVFMAREVAIRQVHPEFEEWLCWTVISTSFRLVFVQLTTLANN